MRDDHIILRAPFEEIQCIIEDSFVDGCIQGRFDDRITNTDVYHFLKYIEHDINHTLDYNIKIEDISFEREFETYDRIIQYVIDVNGIKERTGLVFNSMDIIHRTVRRLVNREEVRRQLQVYISQSFHNAVIQGFFSDTRWPYNETDKLKMWTSSFISSFEHHGVKFISFDIRYNERIDTYTLTFVADGRWRGPIYLEISRSTLRLSDIPKPKSQEIVCNPPQELFEI